MPIRCRANHVARHGFEQNLPWPGFAKATTEALKVSPHSSHDLNSHGRRRPLITA
jgi:hypothetical protein